MAAGSGLTCTHRRFDSYGSGSDRCPSRSRQQQLRVRPVAVGIPIGTVLGRTGTYRGRDSYYFVSDQELSRLRYPLLGVRPVLIETSTATASGLTGSRRDFDRRYLVSNLHVSRSRQPRLRLQPAAIGTPTSTTLSPTCAHRRAATQYSGGDYDDAGLGGFVWERPRERADSAHLDAPQTGTAPRDVAIVSRDPGHGVSELHRCVPGSPAPCLGTAGDAPGLPGAGLCSW